MPLYWNTDPYTAPPVTLRPVVETDSAPVQRRRTGIRGTFDANGFYTPDSGPAHFSVPNLTTQNSGTTTGSTGSTTGAATTGQAGSTSATTTTASGSQSGQSNGLLTLQQLQGLAGVAGSGWNAEVVNGGLVGGDNGGWGDGSEALNPTFYVNHNTRQAYRYLDDPRWDASVMGSEAFAPVDYQYAAFMQDYGDRLGSILPMEHLSQFTGVDGRLTDANMPDYIRQVLLEGRAPAWMQMSALGEFADPQSGFWANQEYHGNTSNAPTGIDVMVRAVRPQDSETISNPLGRNGVYINTAEGERLIGLVDPSDPSTFTSLPALNQLFRTGYGNTNRNITLPDLNFALQNMRQFQTEDGNAWQAQLAGDAWDGYANTHWLGTPQANEGWDNNYQVESWRRQNAFQNRDRNFWGTPDRFFLPDDYYSQISDQEVRHFNANPSEDPDLWWLGPAFIGGAMFAGGAGLLGGATSGAAAGSTAGTGIGMIDALASGWISPADLISNLATQYLTDPSTYIRAVANGATNAILDNNNQ